ncbi:MAG: DNA adenine methylase, partial [Candidatus Marinimicrobia bacterium]|nr:DNA adenine methylase [Candidatus Neomarinimicrobiota bacterium]
MNNFYSPLRYPGGKSSLRHIISKILLINNIDDSNYYEPFAGGSGLGLYLLMNGFVSNIFLNDADVTIYSFWKSILENGEKFIERIRKTDISIAEWKKQKAVISSLANHTLDEIGFATFFLNRCNRSGIISYAGPIGGKNQEGEWKIDVRFNKTDLIQRIKRIIKYKNRIFFYNLDAINFLKSKLPRGNQRKNVFVYIDPPYYNKGKSLYLNYYTNSDHKILSSYIKRQKTLNWVMTYDNVQQIISLYGSFHIFEYSLKYSLQDKKEGKEIFITPHNLIIPNSNIIPRHDQIPMI